MPKGVTNKRYTGEFKEQVIKDLLENRLAVREVMRTYHINDHKVIERWERIYLEEGPEGLYVERRGQASAASGTQKGRKPKLEKRVEEDLIEENQRLRAENAYLKNLQALVLEDERLQHKKRW